jgi:hypothetical protein
MCAQLPSRGVEAGAVGAVVGGSRALAAPPRHVANTPTD